MHGATWVGEYPKLPKPSREADFFLLPESAKPAPKCAKLELRKTEKRRYTNLDACEPLARRSAKEKKQP
jgi:hypothetical protein